MKHRCNFLPIALRESAYLDIHILMMQYTRACYLPSRNINTLNRKILLTQNFNNVTSIVYARCEIGPNLTI